MFGLSALLLRAAIADLTEANEEQKQTLEKVRRIKANLLAKRAAARAEAEEAARYK